MGDKRTLRDYANQFNMVLLQRAQKLVEDFHKSTGITKLLGGDQEKNSRNTFDKLYKDHIVEGHKTRNIRGLFRVPDAGHLVVEAEKDDEQKEQQLQIPENDKAQVEHKTAMMSYPMRKPDVLQREEDIIEERNEDEMEPLLEDIDDVEGMIKVDKIIEHVDETNKEELLQNLYNDEIYKYDKQPRTFKEYIKLARNNPGAVIAIMNPWTREPQFVLKDNGRVTKIYENNNAISRFYRFYPKDVQLRTAGSLGLGKVSDDYFGQFKHDKVDQIRLQEHPVKFDKEKLPDDVLLIQHGKNNDDDPDAGGEMIKNEQDFMRRHHEELKEEVDSDEEDQLKRIRQQGHYQELNKTDNNNDDDDIDKGDMFHSPKSKKSDDYRLEIANLNNEKDKLSKELRSLKVELPKYNNYIKELGANVGGYRGGVDYLKQIEDSGSKDYEYLKREYVQQKTELDQLGFGTRELENALKQLKDKYDQDIIDQIQKYNDVKQEAIQEINDLKRNYEQQIDRIKSDAHNVIQEKDNIINGLQDALDGAR